MDNSHSSLALTLPGLEAIGDLFYFFCKFRKGLAVESAEDLCRVSTSE